MYFNQYKAIVVVETLFNSITVDIQSNYCTVLSKSVNGRRIFSRLQMAKLESKLKRCAWTTDRATEIN